MTFEKRHDVRLPEGPVRSINKKAVYGALGVGFLLLGFILMMLVTPSEGRRERTIADETFSPAKIDSEVLNRLPDSYDEVASKQMAIDEELDYPNAAQDVELLTRPQTQYRSDYSYSAPQQNPYNEARDEKETARQSSMMFVSNPRESATAPPARESELFFERPQRKLNDKEIFVQGQRPVHGIKEAPDFALMQGSVLPAVLLTAINSDLPGPILAQVTTNIFDSKSGRHLLIPQGSKLIGEYNSTVSYGQERAQVVWTRLILPNSDSVDLGRMPGVDQAGAAGIRGSVDQHYGSLAVGVLVTSLLGASLNASPVSPGGLTPQQALGQSLGGEVARVGTNIAERNLNIQPTLSIAAGTKMNVFATADLLLKPYT